MFGVQRVEFFCGFVFQWLRFRFGICDSGLRVAFLVPG